METWARCVAPKHLRPQDQEQVVPALRLSWCLATPYLLVLIQMPLQSVIIHNDVPQWELQKLGQSLQPKIQYLNQLQPNKHGHIPETIMFQRVIYKMEQMYQQVLLHNQLKLLQQQVQSQNKVDLENTKGPKRHLGREGQQATGNYCDIGSIPTFFPSLLGTPKCHQQANSSLRPI